MKNAILILLTFCAATVYGQSGINQHRPTVAPSTRPVVQHPMVVSGGIGTNAYARPVATPTMRYTGAVTCAPAYTVLNQRTRYRTPHHGRFRWEIREERRCMPGYWVMDRGCRRWIAPRTGWTVISRFKTPCAPQLAHR
jgi:hypothetical protein